MDCRIYAGLQPWAGVLTGMSDLDDGVPPELETGEAGSKDDESGVGDLVDMAPVALFIRPSEGDNRVLEALLARVSEPASKDFAREAVILAACERLREVVPAGASATWRTALQARLAAALCDKLEPVFARAGPLAAEGGPPSAVSVTDAVYADVEERDTN